MKDETGGIAIEEFVGLKSKMYSFLVDGDSKNKKGNGVNINVVATINHNKYKVYCWVKNIQDFQLMEFKVKTIEYELTKSTKFHCLVLMTTYIFTKMDIVD